MGACTFDTIRIVKGDVREAYSEALEEARDYNGHQEGYSGDIQTVNGYRVVRDFPTYDSKKFWSWIDSRLGNLGKRECEVIEITGAGLKKLKENRGLKGRKGYRAFMFYGWGAE